jgi:hypothetical protein
MKALELGRTLPQDEPWSTPARIALSIGAGVPIGVYVIAWLAALTIGTREEIWMGATSIGLTGVITGSILAGKHFAMRAKAEADSAALYAHKATIDDDAFDVVSRRG